MADNVVHAKPTSTVEHTIASYLYSYLQEPMLLLHLYFMKGYLKKTPEFLGVHMAVHYYIQHAEFEDMENNWRTMDDFKAFVDSFPANTEYKMEKLAKDYLKQAKDRFS